MHRNTCAYRPGVRNLQHSKSHLHLFPTEKKTINYNVRVFEINEFLKKKRDYISASNQNYFERGICLLFCTISLTCC